MLPERRVLPLDQWPAEDRRRWIEGLRTGDLFEASGAGACWSPQAPVQAPARLWALAHLVAYNHRPASTMPTVPGDRVSPARVAAYATGPGRDLRALYARGSDPGAVPPRPGTAARLALAGPCFFATLRNRATPVRDKRQRLRPAAELVELGRRLMREADPQAHWLPRARAVQYGDRARMIALLALLSGAN